MKISTLELRRFLSTQSLDNPKNRQLVETMLCSCWVSLTGGDDQGMEGNKLIDRMENIKWEDPVLKFNIERHGAAALGSVYGEVQAWLVNLASGKAEIEAMKRRQIGQKDGPLKVEPIAREMLDAITNHIEDDRLDWKRDGTIKVLISEVVPQTNKQTTSARRKRFWLAFETGLPSLGWKRRSSRSAILEGI